MNGYIITADGWYGKEVFIDILMQNGLGSEFVMPDHILGSRPFVAKSFLNHLWGDLEEEVAEDDQHISDAVIAESTNNVSVTSAQLSMGKALSNSDHISAEVGSMESITPASESMQRKKAD